MVYEMFGAALFGNKGNPKHNKKDHFSNKRRPFSWFWEFLKEKPLQKIDLRLFK